MSAPPRAGDMPAHRQAFDILQNPFAVLNLSPDASREDIVAAYDDGIADGTVDEGRLREARRQLLAPKLRLQATAEFFPDATQAGRQEAVAALRRDSPLSDLIALAKELPTFSRIVFLSQIAQLRPSSGLLRYFALSQAQLNRDAIVKTISELLTQSGNPQPQTEAINTAVDEVAFSSADRLFVGYAGVGAAAGDLTRCLQEELPTATGDQISALNVVVDAYIKKAAPSLQTARRKVEDAAEAIRRDPGVPGGTGTLISVLTEWDSIAQPQQLLASHKGRDEGGARDLFQFLRVLMLELANELDQPKIALEINEACLGVFAELPRAEQQLREDQASLKSLADQATLHDLSEFVASAKKDPDPLVRDLNQSGFGEGARGSAGRLYSIFNRSLVQAEGTSAAEYAWGLVRVLALELNNELGEAVASQRIIEGLHAHPRFPGAPASMRAAIETDLQTIRSNVIHTKLNRAVEQKDRRQARVHLAELISVTKDPTERQQYQQTINEIDAANRGRITSWVMWGVIALVVIGFAASQSNSGSTYRPSPQSSPVTVPSPTISTAEVKPPVGTNLSFDRENIRYCLFQSARLDAAQAMLATETSDGVINAFNMQVNDYNSRCGSFRYYDDDMSAVRSELVAKRYVLVTEGQDMVRTWRVRF